MNEFELMQALAGVDIEVLRRGERLIKNLAEIKNHHQSIKHIMQWDAHARMSEDDIESVARLLSTLMHLTDSKKKKEVRTNEEDNERGRP